MLFLEVPSTFVDINVHPSKLEVRFSNVGAVSNLIQEALASTLLMFREKPDVPYSRPESSQSSQPSFSYDRKPSNYSGSVSFQPSIPQMDEPPQKAEVEQDSFYSFQFKNYKILGVLFGVYLVIEKDDTVIFLDQHASHERITFTSLQKNISLKSGLSQMLVAPSIVKLGAKEIVSVKENLELFNNSGFALEIFDDESVIIRAVPAVGYETDWNGIVKEMAGQLENYGFADKVQEDFLSHLATKACRASVKRNDPLTEPEINALIADINESKVLTCPHGRPFFFTMSKNDFEKKVHRQ
jgi:DNA mismatch repair protein MutL